MTAHAPPSPAPCAPGAPSFGRRGGAWLLGVVLGAAALVSGLGGCAALQTLQTDIATYGEWPAGRAPGRYVFDRLPSQQSRPEATDRLEALARPALAQAGFREAAAGETADVLVQLAVRRTRIDPFYWDDPLWWRGGYAMTRRGWVGPVWVRGAWLESPRYEREVAVLLRDQASGRPLYEARSNREGFSAGSEELIEAMFRAALIDFPRNGPNPRSVRVPMP
ncbi:MAG: DUF4136 domain-containing protein [Rubrivivax sp.]